MAAVATYDEAIEWIAKQTVEISNIKYGRNDFSGRLRSHELSSCNGTIREYESTIENVLNKTPEEEKKDKLQHDYNNLKAICEKKAEGAQVIVGVTSLEENCSRVSREMDRDALSLTRESQRQTEHQQPTQVDNQPGFVATVAQDAIFGLRDNWNWIVQLVKCVDIHLKNASDYHQFFHEVKQTEPWLLKDMSKLLESMEPQDTSGSEDETRRLFDELKGITVTVRQWESRVNRIWESAVRLKPLPLRIDGVQEPTAAVILCDYETSEIAVRESEEVLLLENSDPSYWKVRNGRGQEALVPAVIVLIPGPDAGVIEAAVRLRLQLLAAWTNMVKRIGAVLIRYMIAVFKPDYSTKEIASLTSFGKLDKKQLLDLLSFIEDTLQKNWADHDGFIVLQERLLALRMILEETSDKATLDDGSLHKQLFAQLTTLSQIIDLYQSLFGNWEKYKVALEASRQPELMLIVDKWEQLQYVSREFFAKFWKTTLPVGGDAAAAIRLEQFTIDGEEFEDRIHAETTLLQSTETSDDTLFLLNIPDVVDESLASAEITQQVFTTTFTTDGTSRNAKPQEATNQKTVVTINVGDFTDSSTVVISPGRGGVRVASVGGVEEVIEEEIIEEIKETTLRQSQSEEHEGTDFGVATERKTAETEQLTAAEHEEKKTFTIRSVINPVDGSEIALQKAIMLGIMRPDEGLYVNIVTGETKPIPLAMNEGLIKVMFTTTKRSQEKTSSVGIITVKTIREAHRPYVIVSVRDTLKGVDLNLSDASAAGILDERHGTYVDRRTGRSYLITEAADAGLATIEFTGPAPEPEVIAKTYAVRAVVDRRQKKTVTFHEAVRRGIIDRDSGAFVDTQTGDKMYVGDAIMRGFLKARVIDDATTINIDPANRMVIDKTEKIRKRLLQPLGVISAFKMAAAAAGGISK